MRVLVLGIVACACVVAVAGGCHRQQQQRKEDAARAKATRKLAGDPQQRAAEDDRLAQEHLNTAEKADARAWLADPAHGPAAGDRAALAALVEGLHGDGVKETFVTDFASRGQGSVAATLVIVLPTDAPPRARSLERIGAFLRGKGLTPIGDTRQRYVLLSLE